MKRKIILLSLIVLGILIYPVFGDMVIVEQTPKFEFDVVNDIHTDEGEVTLVMISGRAVSGGTINLLGDGPGEERTDWIDGSQKTLEGGKRHLFEAYIKSPHVDEDSKLPITIYVQPSGFGTPTQVTFYNNIRDTENLEKHELQIKCVDSSGEIVENAEIYMDNVFLGYGNIRKSNVVAGEHRVYAEDTMVWHSGFPAKSPKTLYIESDLIFTLASTPNDSKVEPCQKTPFLNIFVVLSIIIILGILLNKRKAI